MFSPLLITQEAENQELDPDIVAAIIYQESKGNVFAIRYEPHFFKKYIDNRPTSTLGGEWPTTTSETLERITRSISFGLMQVMGQTARFYNHFKGPYLTALLDPEVNIQQGCLYLAYLLTRAKALHPKSTKRERYWMALRWYNGSRHYPPKIFQIIKEGRHKRFLPKGDY